MANITHNDPEKVEIDTNSAGVTVIIWPKN